MASNTQKQRAPRNRTINLSVDEISVLEKQLIKINKPVLLKDIENRTIHQDVFEALEYLPDNFADLVFVDPPYNQNKKFNATSFKEMKSEQYEAWLDSWIVKLIHTLKPNASIYICGDWKSSGAVFNVAKKYFKIQNRITFEREKGRGARTNWKNCSEDIWFCTMSGDYHFDVDSVKLKRKIVAPYKDLNGNAKDWKENAEGKYRITYPSNLWTDITIPFWSMLENTDHPTQKPEKLIAKIILASSKPNDVVFDPFLGSGTTSVVAKKLDRRYVGIDIDATYCCLAEKRLETMDDNKEIQGYSDGIFWERNTLNEQMKGSRKKKKLNGSEHLMNQKLL